MFEASGKLIWDAGTRRSLRGFLSNTSIDYSGFHCFHLIMPHSSGKEAEGTGDVCSEPIGALIDLNLATWPCKCPGGSIETDFVWASTVTSGWRGVVTPLSLFGSSLPDHTDSLEQQQRARGDGGCQGRLHTLRFRRLGQFFNIHSEVEASCQGRRRTYGCSGWTASDL